MLRTLLKLDRPATAGELIAQSHNQICARDRDEALAGLVARGLVARQERSEPQAHGSANRRAFVYYSIVPED